MDVILQKINISVGGDVADFDKIRIEFDEKRTDTLREASGHICYKDPMVDFFYLLMRDELPAATVERLVRESINPKGKEISVFTNGWLAQYANNLVELLRNAQTNKMEALLNSDMDDTFFDNLGEAGLKDLEKQIIETHSGVNQPNTSIEDARIVVEQLGKSGGLSKEDVERIEQELKDVKEATEHNKAMETDDDD